MPEVPDLDGFEAYCPSCKTFRLAHRADERDADNGSEYFEFVCSACFTILLTFQKVAANER
jgi:hypothetical protein